MIKRSMLVGAAALALVALGTANRPAAACFKCTMWQECVEGPWGSSCTVEIRDGKQYCQHTLDCNGITLTPLEVSPTGTYVSRGGAQVTEHGVQKQQCNGFVIGHMAGNEGDVAKSVTIRI